MRPLSFVLAFAFFIAGRCFIAKRTVSCQTSCQVPARSLTPDTQLAGEVPQRVTLAAIR